ncbi:hypothetical protein DFH06DRAFT_1411827 [Mycena polygramma]|nr:hypothetical protein DFH06DRAFT_1411825 [Mycena polygramma]KAJ7656090.1 hypothetical protein DFH06DRAFT_1411827 [Mycena polygramma]
MAGYCKKTSTSHDVRLSRSLFGRHEQQVQSGCGSTMKGCAKPYGTAIRTKVTHTQHKARGCCGLGLQQWGQWGVVVRKAGKIPRSRGEGGEEIDEVAPTPQLRLGARAVRTTAKGLVQAQSNATQVSKILSTGTRMGATHIGATPHLDKELSQPSQKYDQCIRGQIPKRDQFEVPKTPKIKSAAGQSDPRCLHDPIYKHSIMASTVEISECPQMNLVYGFPKAQRRTKGPGP